jgi:hypothetical protein
MKPAGIMTRTEAVTVGTPMQAHRREGSDDIGRARPGPNSWVHRSDPGTHPIMPNPISEGQRREVYLLHSTGSPRKRRGSISTHLPCLL